MGPLISGLNTLLYGHSIYVDRIGVKREFLDYSQMSFGARLREARKRAGLSQVTLAAQLGVAQKIVSEWEADVFMPRGERLSTVAPVPDSSQSVVVRTFAARPQSNGSPMIGNPNSRTAGLRRHGGRRVAIRTESSDTEL